MTDWPNGDADPVETVPEPVPSDGNCMYASGIVEDMKPSELRKLREKAGLTQAALASRLGVTTNTVARWEQGARGISEPMSRLIRAVITAREGSK